MSLDSFEIAVLLECLREGRKGLIERVRRYRTNRPSEDVCLYQPDSLHEFRSWESAIRVVLVQLQQERIGNIDFQLTQVMKGALEVCFRLSPERHGAEVPGEVTDVSDERLHPGLSRLR